jgi:hypothetical protein
LFFGGSLLLRLLNLSVRRDSSLRGSFGCRCSRHFALAETTFEAGVAFRESFEVGLTVLPKLLGEIFRPLRAIGGDTGRVNLRELRCSGVARRGTVFDAAGDWFRHYL